MLFDNMRQSMRKSMNMLDGWITGRLIVAEGKAYLELEDKSEIELSPSDNIEVLNDKTFMKISYKDILEKVTQEGWPLFAGLETRIKH